MRQDEESKRHITVTSHRNLEQVTENDIRENGASILQKSDHGIQTSVVSSDGTIRAVMGMNCIRLLPDADPDPLDELFSLLGSAKEANK